MRLLCEDVNCDDVQEQGFLEPLMMSRHVRRTTSPLHSDRDTTHNSELKERQCASCAQPRKCAKDHAPSGAKRDAQQASASGLKTDTFSILRDSQNIPLVYLFKALSTTRVRNTSVLWDRLTHVQ